MTNKIILFLGIACLVLAVLYFRSCQAKLPDHSQDKKEVDSLVEKAMKDSIVAFKKIDSAKHTIVVLTKTKDSLTQLLTVTKSDLKGKDKDITGLIDEINKAEGANNTAEALIACDSLKSLYPSTKALVVKYMTESDSLRAVNNHIIGSKDTIIAHLSTLFTTANGSLFETSRLYSNLTVDYRKLVKNSGKRFGIGPQLTVSVVGGRFAICPGLGVTYNLIRF